jgi:hypothetical protein
MSRFEDRAAHKRGKRFSPLRRVTMREPGVRLPLDLGAEFP